MADLTRWRAQGLLHLQTSLHLFDRLEMPSRTAPLTCMGQNLLHPWIPRRCSIFSSLRTISKVPSKAVPAVLAGASRATRLGEDFGFLTVLLHNLKVLDDNLGAGADENLALSRLLGVVKGLESVGKDTHTHPGGAGGKARQNIFSP